MIYHVNNGIIEMWFILLRCTMCTYALCVIFELCSLCILFFLELTFIENTIFINFKQQTKMKARSNAKTQEKNKLQKLFPIQKKLLNLYDALLQASSFSNDEF